MSTTFSTYLYNPDDPDLVQRVEADIEEFRFVCPDKHRLIRYTILTYDPHTDFIKLFPSDLSRRKYEAAIKAGFTLTESGKFELWVEDCMVGSNQRYNDAIVAFVTRFNVADLPAYLMYREVFFAEMKVVLSADTMEVDKKTASALRKEAIVNAENARQKIQELERKLFTGDEVSDIRNALYVKAEKMLLQLRPESMAHAIETSTLSISDPYYPKKKAGRPKKV